MTATDWQDQIFYQVFVRSFCDGNGDGVGDFTGLVDKLDYLVELGVTALWLNPIFPSETHHNYFTTNFLETDHDYGSTADFAALCRAAHERGLRTLLDMETQYVPREHPWFVDAFGNPPSPFTPYFLFRGDRNTDPVHLSLEFTHDGEPLAIELPEIVTLNLAHPGVVDAQRAIYTHWLDPLGRGRPGEGVDGYRLDHIMDDLDHKGILDGLLKGFWRPLIDDLRAVDPRLFFLAEPADWTRFGGELLRDADMDGAFAMPLMFAVRSFDKSAIVRAIQRMHEAVPSGKLPFVLLENHDVSRFATEVGEDPGRERVGAALLLTLEGVPTLYYGQEIGMTGKIGLVPADYHLPAREAFRWSADSTAPGMAVWYRNRPHWRHTGIERDDGRTLDAQRNDPASLWTWYRRLIALRRRHIALRRGGLDVVSTRNDQVLAFTRTHSEQSILVAVNLSSRPQHTDIDWAAAGVSTTPGGALLLGEPLEPAESPVIAPYAVSVVQLLPKELAFRATNIPQNG